MNAGVSDAGPRVRWSYVPRDGGPARELPLRVLVVGAFSPRATGAPSPARATAVEPARWFDATLRSILHAPEFQSLDVAWRSLAQLVARVGDGCEIELELLDLSREELAAELRAGPPERSSLARALGDTDRRGHRVPFGLVVTDFVFGPGPDELELLARCAAIAADAVVPLFANAAPGLVGVPSWTRATRLPPREELDALPELAGWRVFRTRPEAAFVGLCVPRVRVRLPHGERARHEPVSVRLEFIEGEGERDPEPRASDVFGPASFALGAVVARAFARTGTCRGWLGPRGGALQDVPFYMPPALGPYGLLGTETSFSEREDHALACHGMIPLVWRRDADGAAFFSAPMCGLSTGVEDPVLREIRSRAEHTLLVSRVAHYVMAIAHEHAALHADPAALEAVLDRWLRHQISDIDRALGAPSPRLLRDARVRVEEAKGAPGERACELAVRPAFREMGRDFWLEARVRLRR